MNQYHCPLCGTPMDHPPRDWNICPNPACFVEFGYDAPMFADDGTPLTPHEPEAP